MKLLKVKRYFQPEHSVDCGPTSVQMALDHFGIKRSLAELKKGMHYAELGTYLYENGSLLLREGLRVSLVTANPILFSWQDRKKLKTSAAILNRLKRLRASKDVDLKKHKRAIGLFIKFIENGGIVRLEVPAVEHIKKAINVGSLVLPIYYPRATSATVGRFHHTSVIHGYDTKSFYITDPLPSIKAKKLPIDDFMYSLAASTGADVDNGSLLIVGRKV